MRLSASSIILIQSEVCVCFSRPVVSAVLTVGHGVVLWFLLRWKPHQDVHARSADHHVHPLGCGKLRGGANGASCGEAEARMGVSFNRNIKKKNQTAVMISSVTKRRLSGLVCVLDKQNIEFDQNPLDERLRVEACLCRSGKRRASRLTGVSRCLQACPVVSLTLAVTGTEAKTAEPMFISFRPERSSTLSPPSSFCLTLRSGRRGITSDTPTVSSGKEKVA